MASEQYTLYDLASKLGHTWSFNPWKARMVLNFKGVDYKTEWVEFPDIKACLEKRVAPNDGSSSQFEYTLPVVQFPDGKCIMDSLKIARAIEEAHPEPSLRLDSPYVAKMLELDRPLLMASVPAWVSKLPERLLNDSSKQYMYETRQKFLGMHPAEFEKKFGPGSWDKLAPILQQVTDMLKENTAGPFFDGEKAGFADFIWLGFLVFWRTIGDDIWENVLKIMGEDKEVHLKLLEAGEPFIERKSH